MLREGNKVFASQPLDLRGGNSNPTKPLGPLGYFGLPMVNPGRPPLPPNRPYRWPFNYLDMLKILTKMFMSKYLKLPLEQIVKQMIQKLLICSVLPLKILYFISIIIIWEITHIILLWNYNWLIVRGIEKFRIMNMFSCS